MKVFIIGGAGFIGSHVCRAFVRNQHHVAVFGPPLQESLLEDMEGQIQRIQGDILDLSSLFQGLLETKPDLIIHLAAFGAGSDGLAKSAQHSPKKALDVNIMGFHNVLEAAKVTGVAKVLWSGSSTVFGSEGIYQESRVKEHAAYSPSTFYGSTKVMDELMTRYYREQFEMEICGVRLPLVYGPGRWYKGAGGALVDMFERSAFSDEVVVTGGQEAMDFMYVKDVAGVFYHLAASEKSLSDVYNVKSHTATLTEMAETVKGILPHYRLTLTTEPSAVIYPLMDTSRIEEEQSYQPQYTLHEACEDYLNEVRRKNV